EHLRTDQCREPLDLGRPGAAQRPPVLAVHGDGLRDTSSCVHFLGSLVRRPLRSHGSPTQQQGTIGRCRYGRGRRSGGRSALYAGTPDSRLRTAPPACPTHCCLCRVRAGPRLARTVSGARRPALVAAAPACACDNAAASRFSHKVTPGNVSSALCTRLRHEQAISWPDHHYIRVKTWVSSV